MVTSALLSVIVFISLPHNTVTKYIINDNSNSKRIPSLSNKIGVIDILDNIVIQFDMTVHSFTSTNDQYSSILQFGSSENEKFPSIFLNEWSESLRIDFSSVSNANQFWESNTLKINQQYHVQFTVTQTSVQFTVTTDIGGTNTHISQPVTSHSIVFDRDIYIGNPWNTPSNCIITSLVVTTENSSPQFNYLCDYNNRFTPHSGTWSFDPNTCYLRQTDYNHQSATVWLGARDPNTLLWTDYSVETQFIIEYDPQTYGWADVRIGTRVQSIGNEYDHYLETGSANQIAMQKLTNGVESTLFQKTHPLLIGTNTLYTLRVDVTGNVFDVYLNGEFQQSHTDSTYSIGSIALKMYMATVEFRYLYISFPNNGQLYTANPTSFPTDAPSQVPSTNPSRSPSNFPSMFPSHLPTQSPSTFPSNLPSTFPSQVPSTVPSEFPTSFPTILPSKSPTYSYSPISDNEHEVSDDDISTTISRGKLQSETEAQLFGKTSMLILLLLSIIICLCILFGGVGYYKYHKRKKTKKNLDMISNVELGTIETNTGATIQSGLSDGETARSVTSETDEKNITTDFETIYAPGSAELAEENVSHEKTPGYNPGMCNEPTNDELYTAAVTTKGNDDFYEDDQKEQETAGDTAF